MSADPLAGLIYHWIGGLAAASFYIPYKLIRLWAWETYWLVGGFFAWIIAPVVLASLFVPGLWDILQEAPARSIGMAYFWGIVWGVGGVTYGLTMRYLGIALGVAIALGLCTAFGTLLPPLVGGEMGTILSERSGQVILGGIAVCLGGIVVSGMAGVSKERELTDVQKKDSVAEFHFWKGLVVAILCGVMSAAFAYGLAAGKPIAEVARVSLANSGRSDLWQNLPVLIVVTAGGFTTNFFWCLYLNLKNRTSREYVAFRRRDVAEIDASQAVTPYDAGQIPESTTDDAAAEQVAPPSGRVPLLANYFFAAAGGVIWYLQFFFYSMGETRMGRDYAFSSWTLHMASIIIFGTLWGIALKEWKGTSGRTRTLVGLGLLVLVGSTVIVGYGNFLKASPGGH